MPPRGDASESRTGNAQFGVRRGQVRRGARVPSRQKYTTRNWVGGPHLPEGIGPQVSGEDDLGAQVGVVREQAGCDSRASIQPRRR